MVRYGLSVPNFAVPARLVELAVASEAAGWDGFFLWDHIVVDRSSPPLICEPWTTLAAAAVMTTRIRLGTLVTHLCHVVVPGSWPARSAQWTTSPAVERFLESGSVFRLRRSTQRWASRPTPSVMARYSTRH